MLTRVTSSDQNPWSFIGRELVTSRHWEVNVFSEVFEIVDGLLDCVVFQASNA